jgi:hypothetical protein
LSSFSLSLTCSVFALVAIHLSSRNALMRDTSKRRPLESLKSRREMAFPRKVISLHLFV